MKNLILVIILAVAGYFAYQHFIAPQEETEEEDTSISRDQLPPIPEKCKRKAKNFKNAVYGAASGETSFTQRNLAEREFRSCLHNEGFSDPEIQGTVAELADQAKAYLE